VAKNLNPLKQASFVLNHLTKNLENEIYVTIFHKLKIYDNYGVKTALLLGEEDKYRSWCVKEKWTKWKKVKI